MFHILPTALHVLLAVVLLVAVVTDVRYQKVFNWLTFPAIALGVALSALGGWVLLRASLEGLATGLVLGLVFMVFFRSGAGDAKLLICVGTLTSPSFLLGTALYGGIAGLPMALFVMWRRGVFGYTLRNLAGTGILRATGARPASLETTSKAGRMPYATAIALGALVTFLACGWKGLLG